MTRKKYYLHGLAYNSCTNVLFNTSILQNLKIIQGKTSNTEYK